MAKQPKFSADKLAAELLASGNATPCKVDFMLSHLANLAANFVRPSDQAACFALANICENLINVGFNRTRLVYTPTAPDGVERLTIRFPNFTVRLSLRVSGNSRELSCSYLSGSIPLPHITSTRTVIEFITQMDLEVNKWVTEWEQVLFVAWQTARQMQKAVSGIEPYVEKKATAAGLHYVINMLTNYAEIVIIVCRGLKLTAKVPHEKFELSVDNLIEQAKEVDKTIRILSDDINISA